MKTANDMIIHQYPIHSQLLLLQVLNKPITFKRRDHLIRKSLSIILK
jgi:hypothetical protein